MESKAESKFVEHITIDFYGDTTYLNQDLHAFTNLFPKDLYKGIDEYWDHFLEENFVKKQRSMIEFCKEIREDTSGETLKMRKEELYSIIGDSSYYLITADKFSVSQVQVNHPSSLLKNDTNIHFFQTGRNENMFNSPEFYTSRPFLNNMTIMLTNGANTNLNSDGSGTTGGLRELNDKNFFTTCELLYQPSDEIISSLGGIPVQNNQLIKPQCINTASSASFPAGTVFKNDNVLKLSEKFAGVTTVVKGVYHIKGINWKLVSIEENKLERQIENINFVKEYYSKILDDFYEKGTDVLFLAQIPGYFFQGEQGTELGLVQAVSTFNLPGNQHIIVGIDKPEKMKNLNTKYMLWYNLLTYNSINF